MKSRTDLSGRRLLVLNTSRSWGGNEFWAVRVAAGMAARGAAVRFMATHDVVAARAKAAGLEVMPLKLAADGDVRGLLRLREAMTDLRAEAVLATRWREYLHAGVAARLAGRPRPRVVMGLGLKVEPRDDVKRRLIFRLTDRVIVNSPEIRDALLKKPWLSPEQIAVVLNGVDLDVWQPRWHPDAVAAGSALRDELGIAAAAPLLLAVGVFSPQKDFGRLLESVARMRETVPDLRLLILGDGFLRPELESRRAELGLKEAVLMPGFSSDVAPAMAAADLMVLSSNNEGMAWVLLEAAASGLPAVATDVSGTRHAVADQETGLVVPPGDAIALAEGVLALLSDSDRRQAMGRGARQLAEERFSADRMLDETAAILFDGQ